MQKIIFRWNFIHLLHSHSDIKRMHSHSLSFIIKCNIFMNAFLLKRNEIKLINSFQTLVVYLLSEI